MMTQKNKIISVVSLAILLPFMAINALAGELPANTVFNSEKYNTPKVLDKDLKDEFNPLCDYRIIVRTDNLETGSKDNVQVVTPENLNSQYMGFYLWVDAARVPAPSCDEEADECPVPSHPSHPSHPFQKYSHKKDINIQKEDYVSDYVWEYFSLYSDNKTVIRYPYAYVPAVEQTIEGYDAISRRHFDIIEEHCLVPAR